jgi:hypothetical protein
MVKGEYIAYPVSQQLFTRLLVGLLLGPVGSCVRSQLT